MPPTIHFYIPMNDQDTGTLDALVQERMDADTDFQATLADLSDDEKNAAIQTKRGEVIESEFSTLRGAAAETAKAKDLADNYKKRAEKAEKALKEGKPAEGADEKKDDLSGTDIYALRDAKVPLEDVEEVKKAALLMGVSIQDALKDTTFQGILAKRLEVRTTAEATNKNGGRRGAAAPTDETVLADANAGKVPAKGSKEAEQLFFARRKR